MTSSVNQAIRAYLAHASPETLLKLVTANPRFFNGQSPDMKRVLILPGGTSKVDIANLQKAGIFNKPIRVVLTECPEMRDLVTNAILESLLEIKKYEDQNYCRGRHLISPYQGE